MNGEFDFIKRIRERVAHGAGAGADLRCGIGDDAAIIGQRSGRETLITVDLLVEEIDFRLEYAVPRWLGHKALAVSLSDIAAMGGRPEFALLTLGIPPHLTSRHGGDPAAHFWDGFFDGYFALADRHGVALIGGDISANPDRLTIDSIVMGSCESGRAVRRTGARTGEAIYVTGRLGASAVGLRRLLRGERVVAGEETLEQEALRAHLAPTPRVEFGRRLGESGLAGAMIDISDGLGQDLAHLCTESGVGAVLERRAIPVAACLALPGLPDLNEEERFELAVSGGEDFELLFTAAPEAEGRLRELAGPDLRLTRIGRIVARPSPPVLPPVMINDGKTLRPLHAGGYDHFAG
jgi:thiamine-monophosphate kinase